MKLKTLVFIAASSAMSLPAFAADPWDITATDTQFGLPISNTATLSYSVNSTPINKSSNTIEFKVDRKVIFSVTDNHTGTDPVAVTAGDKASTIYTLQNDSNAPISFKLPVPPAGTEYKYGSKTITNSTPANSPDLVIDLPKGNLSDDTDKLAITVEISIPDDAASDFSVTSSLALTAVEPADNPDIEKSGVSTGVVKGDPIIASTNTDDWKEDKIQTVSLAGLLDGSSVKLTSEQKFIVSAANISLAKGVIIKSDPINGTTKPKAIPGAIVEYTLTITNAGLVAATGVNLSDDVPSAFKLTDSYVETYTIDGNSATPAIVGNKITFNNLTIAAATDTSNAATYGKTVIKFTVRLP